MVNAKEKTVPKVERFFLHQDETDMSGTDTKRCGAFEEAFRYQVPSRHELVFSPEDVFGCYLYYVAADIAGALADDGGAITDERVEANEATANDMTLMPAGGSEATNDAYYFGQAYPFSNLRLKYTTAGACTAKDLAWEYYNGSAWVAIPNLTDGTEALVTAAGTHNVNFAPPGDWAEVAVDGMTAYWIRARIVTADYTTSAIGDQAWIGGCEMHDDDLVRIEVRSPNGGERRTLLQSRYGQLKDITDRDKLYPLAITEQIIAGGGDWVVISVKSTGELDVSASHFVLECARVKPSMF